MSATTFVCAKCGAENSIAELVTVEIAVQGWRGIKVEAGEGGAPKASAERDNYGIDSDSADLRYPDVSTGHCYAYHCAECELQVATLAEAVTAVTRVEVECRECGFDGDAADHPEACDGELLGLGQPSVNPDQVALEIAA